ncbi:MAG: FAD-binding protein [Burkholderiaceae bacterium]|nr:FAD-binding protein [Burkholderiaceae bacterium]
MASNAAVAVAHPASGARSRLAQRLRRTIRGEVLFDRASRGRYATDASIYQVDPVGVVVPADEADVLAAIELARELRVPILPRGGGTSQCGQTVGEALVIDNSKHLDKVVAFDRDRATVEVQPGIVLDRLNAFLRPHGLWYPVDVSTSAQATLGGMAGNNSCGSRSIAYGNMVHNVTGIDAVLADGTQEHFGPFGERAKRALATSRASSLVSSLFELAAQERDEIERVWPRVMRRVGGYNLDVFHPRSERPYTSDGSVNLAHLLVGSEGTLAYFRRLHLKLSALPRARALGVVNFPSFHRAMQSAQHLVALGPSAVELVDRTMIELSRANPVFRPTIDSALIGEPQAVLLVEFCGDDREALRAKLGMLGDLMGELGLPGTVVERPDEARQKALWEVRKAGLNIMMSLRGDGKPVSFIEDCAVPLEHLAEYTAGLTEVFARHGTRGTWYAHASVGTLHVRPILDMRAGDATKMRAIAEEAAAMVRRYKGAFSGEHGDGLVRTEWVRWQFGERITRAFERVKDLFDPLGLMNPGKIVRGTRMDDERLFRFPPGYRVAPLTPALDWTRWNVHNDPATELTSAPGSGGDPTGGFAKAVEMCNNNGHCRKFDAGTMCPSYRVTRDERHLTRGRANTLRLALSGALGGDALASRELYDTMALCVGCKGCKRECPTGVDMTRMKTEFLHHYHSANPRSIRDRLVAFLPRYAPLAARLGWLANLRDTVPGLARLGDRLIGLSARRSLPRWRAGTFLRECRRSAPGADAQSADVVLFADTFNNYFEPNNLRAARRVLEAAGYRVAIATPLEADGARALCCGRTFLASGMVDEARAEARRTLAALMPFVERGVAVVGLEPSCLLTLRDEFLVLGLGEGAARLALHAHLFEEFLAREHESGRLRLGFESIGKSRALLHGHCHQKAFDAVRPIKTVLGLIPGLQVELIESGCCGMAGSFGYQSEHHEMSFAMAEAGLLPAVRSADADTVVVADGTSCRHQIRDGAQREALHVARVLELALPPERDVFV